MKKTLLFWLCFALGIIFATYFAVRIIMTVMGNGAAAHVKNIRVTSSASNHTVVAIATNIGIAPGTRVYSLNLKDVNNRVLADPGVKTSATRRMPNGNLRVYVKMHRAVALWTDGEVFYPVDSTGVIIKTPIQARDDNAIVFRGNLPDDILEITKSATEIADKLDYIEWIENRRWNLIINGGLVVKLPESNPIAAFNAMMLLDKNHQILSKEIKVLDMRDGARTLVK